MGARIEGTIWAHECSGANGDRTGVDEGAVAVDEDAFSKSSHSQSAWMDVLPEGEKVVRRR